MSNLMIIDKTNKTANKTQWPVEYPVFSVQGRALPTKNTRLFCGDLRKIDLKECPVYWPLCIMPSVIGLNIVCTKFM